MHVSVCVCVWMGVQIVVWILEVNPYQFRLAPFQELKSHVWSGVTILDSTDNGCQALTV